MKRIFIPIILGLVLNSCTIELSKFATIDKILLIKVGMIREQVDLIIGVKAYDLKSLDDNGDFTVVYKYRVNERKVDKKDIQPTNGIEVWGKYGELYVTYNKDEKVIKATTCLGGEISIAPIFKIK